MKKMENCSNEAFNKVVNNEVPEKKKPSKERLTIVALCWMAALLLAHADYGLEYGGRFGSTFCVLGSCIFTIAAILTASKTKPLNLSKILSLGCLFLLNVSWTISSSYKEMAMEPFFALIALFCLVGYCSVLCSEKTINGIDRRFWIIDVWNAVIAFPISRFFIGVKTVFDYISAEKKAPKEKKNIPAVIVILIITMFLLAQSTSLLMEVDDGFSDLLSTILCNLFDFEAFFSNILNIIDMTIRIFLIKNYLCGSVIGTAEYSDEKLKKRGEHLETTAQKTKSFKDGLWNGILSLFNVLYAVFILFQFSYMFAALMNRVPEGYLVSEYAREGFFELCKVMIINFILLILSTLTVFKEMQNNKLHRIMKLILLIMSIVFALVALSKILLYINTYGFTQLRIEGLWLTIVLLLACVLWVMRLLGAKDRFNLWLMFAMVSFSVLSVIPIL